ncbi:MAG: hypothetical protein K9H14_03520 [Actinomycetia bacterium]|nr:hypothetical protein [Actinomycetes bacterium]
MIKNKLFKTDERIRAFYNQIGNIGFHVLSLLIWLNLIYRMVVLNQRGKEVIDILVILIFAGFLYIYMFIYFIREVSMNKSKEKISGLSVISLILGILSLVLYWGSGILGIPGPLDIITFWSSCALGIVGVICGVIDLFRIKSNRSSIKSRGFDIAGITLGAVGAFLIILMALYLNFWSSST